MWRRIISGKRHHSTDVGRWHCCGGFFLAVGSSAIFALLSLEEVLLSLWDDSSSEESSEYLGGMMVPLKKKRFRITIRSKLVHHAVDTKQPKTEVGGIPPPNSRPPPQRDTHTSVHHTHRYLKQARYYRCLKKWPRMVYRGFQASKYLL